MWDKDILKEICDFLGVKPNHELTNSFINGLNRQLLNYEKLDKVKSPISAIQRYLVGFESFILWNENPPLQYYDIFRSCRHTLSLRFLHYKMKDIQKIKNYEERLHRLVKALTFDELEAILFELVVGAKYAALPGVKHIEFIPESTSLQPDIHLFKRKDIFVECKRMNRSSDDASDIRNCVRKLKDAYVRKVGVEGPSTLFSADFHTDPRNIKIEDWIQGCEVAVRQSFVESKMFTILAENLSPRAFKEFKLFPSAQFYEDEYDYVEGQPWHGITQISQLNYAHISQANYEMGAASSLLSSVGFEIVLKWKLSDPNALKAYTKLNFSLAFKGLKQLKDYDNTILHFAFERNKAAGHRQDSLFSFCHKMEKSRKDTFGWIIFNEFEYSVSRMGRLDLQEHAHILGGPTQFGKKPLVSVVLTEDSPESELAEFGIGSILPDIDSLKDSDFSNAQYQNSASDIKPKRKSKKKV